MVGRGWCWRWAGRGGRSRRRCGDRPRRSARTGFAPTAARRSRRRTARSGPLPLRTSLPTHPANQPAPRRFAPAATRIPPPHRPAHQHQSPRRRHPHATGDNSARARIANDRVKALRALRRAITRLTADIAAAVDATDSTSRDIDDLVAAEISARTGDPTRFKTKAAFAIHPGFCGSSRFRGE